MEELQAAGVVTAMTTSADPVTSGQPAGSEFEESDITNTEGLHKVVEESMDMEMARQGHTTLMITSNREKVWLEALIKEQDHTINEAVRQVQERHLEKVQAITDTSDVKRMGDPVISAAAPPKRKTSRDPVRSLQSMVPCTKKEDAACTVNPNQISSSQPHLVEGIHTIQTHFPQQKLHAQQVLP